MSFTWITVTGSYENEEGVAAAGSIRFLLDGPMYQPGGGTVAPVTKVAGLSAGALSVVLAANDDPTTLGGDSYSVAEIITGAPPNFYSIVVPSAAPGATIDITNCARAA